MKKKTNKKCTQIGGQAVLEGVMMRGEKSMVTAVRDADGIIRVESKRIKPIKSRSKIWRFPIIRGVLAMCSSFSCGIKTLLRSAEVYGEGEPSKFEKWLAEKTRIDIMSIITFMSLALGIGLAILLFIWLPQLIRQGFELLFNTEFSVLPKNLIEGAVKIAVFISYVSLVGLMKDIKRTYMYHGAEHKTIACFESGLEMTTENAKKCSRQHDRCGTTFLFLVIIVSILMFAVIEYLLSLTGLTQVKFYNLYRILIKILSLPLIAGVSYEILKALAKTKSKFFYIFKAPGLALQKITTREPDDEMLEVAIMAFNLVQQMDLNEDIPEVTFVTPKKCSEVLQEVKQKLRHNNIDEVDGEWIVSICAEVKRSEVNSSNKLISPKDIDKINEMVAERLLNKPLWYIVGNTDFYGYTINVDKRVLIPRCETENLVENALKYVKNNTKVLDLCTGSGAIAIAIKAERKGAEVYASDISADALTVAKENAEINGTEITFIESDMFNNIQNKFDVIISNPPYIESEVINTLQKEVKDYEPLIALDGGIDGLDYYKIIANNAKNYLNNGGVVLLEVGYNQAQQVKDLFIDFKTEILKDLEGIDRIVVAKYE